MAHLHSVSNPPSYPQYDFHSLHQSPPSHQAAFAAQPPPPPPPPLPFHPSPGSHGDQQQQRSQRASRLPPFLHDHQQQPHQQRQQPDYHSHHQPRRNPYDHHPDPWSYRPENVYDRQHGLQHQQQSSYQHPPAYHRQSLDHRYFEPPFPAPQPYHSRSHYTERDYYKPSDSHHSFSQRRSYSPNMPRAAASGSSTQVAASTKSRRRPAAPMAAPSASSSRTLTTSTSSSSIAYHFEREHLPTGESREVIVLDDDSPTPPPKKRTTRATAAAADAALLAASGGGASLSSGNAAASTATSNRKRKADDGQTSGGTAKVARGAGLDRQPVASSSTYASSSSRAVVPPPPAAPPAPPSCDDAEGHYIIREGDIIYGRYKIIKKLGEGTFGKVVAAQDRSSRRMYAVKIIRAVQKYRDASKIEIRVLNELKRSDPKNVNKCIHLTECFEHLNHVCLVFELLGSSVFDFLKENNFTPFPMKHIQEFARQLLTSVGYMHKLGLVHTDLKPENILLADSSNFPQNPVANPRQNPPRLLLKNTDIRLIDFGSATFEKEYHSTVVSTRHYRAPEIILGLGWSYPCDMFSIGCILIEFFTGEALFQTHGNLEHLAMMEIVMGKMPETMLKRSIRAKPEFFKNGKLDYPNATTDRASRKFLKGMRRIDQIIPPTDVIKTRFADLIRSLLAFDPERRLKVQDALRHPFFQLVIDLD